MVLGGLPFLYFFSDFVFFLFGKQHKTTQNKTKQNKIKNPIQLVNLTSDSRRPERARSVENTASDNASGTHQATKTTSPKQSASNGGNYSHKKGVNSQKNSKRASLVVKNSKQAHKRKRSESRSRRHAPLSHNDKLKRIMHKQTLLVIVATSTSLVIFFLGAFYAEISLLIPLDFFMNSLCIWFMFRFADGLWDKIVHCCDCCGCCGGMKDVYLTRMGTLSRASRLSIHGGSPHVGSAGISPITVTNEVGTTELFRKQSGHDPIEPQLTDR